MVTKQPFVTSLYKGRLYIITSNGSKYYYNGGTYWNDSIDDDNYYNNDKLKDKLEKYGFSYKSTTEDEQTYYFFTGYRNLTEVTIHGLEAMATGTAIMGNVVAGEAFTITFTGSGWPAELLNTGLGPFTWTVSVAAAAAADGNALADVLQSEWATAVTDNTTAAYTTLGTYLEWTHGAASIPLSDNYVILKAKSPYGGDGDSVALANVAPGDTLTTGILITAATYTGSSGIDYNGIDDGDTFTIENTGWFPAETVTVAITDEQKADFAADAYGNSFVDFLNDLLKNTVITGTEDHLSDYCYFYLYDKNILGIKMYPQYSIAGTDDLTLTDTAGTTVADCFKMYDTTTFTPVNSKLAADFDTLVAAVVAAGGVGVINFTIHNTGSLVDPSFSDLTIPYASIAQVVADVHRLPETFHVR